ncbi:MAG: class I tRNA ligase family protein, partial [Candidatus Nanohaloarchaea archaeon]
DENYEKMSKSKGNVVSPEEVLEEFPVDAARYWCAGSSVGDDLPFKKNDLRSGRKLMTKLWNASKLVGELSGEEQVENPGELDPIDRWMLAELDRNIEEITDHMEEYEFAKARNRLREFFWHTYCDNYLEIAKQKLDGEDSRSTRYALQQTHRAFLKLFAPFLVHITEEIWHDMYNRKDTGSIHLQNWPEPRGIEADLEEGENAMDAIHALRKYKSDHQMAPTEELELVEVYSDISGFEEAVKEAMHLEQLQVHEGSPDVAEEIDTIQLDYEKVGPAYGELVSDMEAALDEDDYELEDGELHLAGETLQDDEFKVERNRTYRGEGEMVEAGDVTLIVRS